jgi:hypothetical protein
MWLRLRRARRRSFVALGRGEPVVVGLLLIVNRLAGEARVVRARSGILLLEVENYLNGETQTVGVYVT